MRYTKVIIKRFSNTLLGMRQNNENTTRIYLLVSWKQCLI